MQPIDVVERVKTTYKSYIKTAFPVIDDDLREQMHATRAATIAKPCRV